jgi:hypothetical protein
VHYKDTVKHTDNKRIHKQTQTRSTNTTLNAGRIHTATGGSAWTTLTVTGVSPAAKQPSPTTDHRQPWPDKMMRSTRTDEIHTHQSQERDGGVCCFIWLKCNSNYLYISYIWNWYHNTICYSTTQKEKRKKKKSALWSSISQSHNHIMHVLLPIFETFRKKVPNNWLITLNCNPSNYSKFVTTN